MKRKPAKAIPVWKIVNEWLRVTDWKGLRLEVWLAGDESGWRWRYVNSEGWIDARSKKCEPSEEAAKRACFRFLREWRV